MQIRKPLITVGCAMVIAMASACGDNDRSVASTPEPQPLDLTILHVNDHHSRLDAETINLNVRTATSNRENVVFPLGGFPRVTQAFDELAAGRANVLKLHAGDAITGDLYYTITNGRADAALMNAICFDAFVLGNHEFDSGDAGLKTFLDLLREGTCRTPVLSANVRPAVGISPLAMTSATDYFRPSTVVERGGRRIGIVGITIADKTRNSSRPDQATEFLDETSSAQAAIDALRAQGIDIVVLLTHQGYAEDQKMARALSGVDVIVGGDSHTLIGPAGLTEFGVTPPAGPYPTRSTDRDGKLVCIVQAWQYSWAVGELQVRFDSRGDVERCDGRPHLLLGNPIRRAASGAAALSDADRAAIATDLGAQPSLRTTAPAARAADALVPFAQQKTAFGATVVGQSDADLCLRRVPGTTRDITRSAIADCNTGAFTNAHGGDVQQLVAQAFLEQGRTFGEADIAMQNGGGVRVDIRQGDVTVGNIYTVLPFRNTLVRLTMTGAEVKQTLEDAISFVLAAPANTGAYPYAAGLRWIVDLNQPAGSRFSSLQVKNASGDWGPLSLTENYRVVTNDFIGAGQDGWVTMRTIPEERRENTFLDYADSFLRYTQRVDTLSRLPVSEYSTQQFIDTP